VPIQHVVDVHGARRRQLRHRWSARSHDEQTCTHTAGFAGPDATRLPQGRPGGGRGEGLPSLR
jgi:hypothetical protein